MTEHRCMHCFGTWKPVAGLVVFAGLSVACGGDTGPAGDAARATVSVSPAALTVPVGGYGSLAAVVTDSIGALLPDASVQWLSAAPGIATVSAGAVFGVSPGVTMVIATAAGKADTATVTVVQADSVSLEILPGSASIPVGGTVPFTVSAHHADGTAAALPAVQWASSNTAVALAPLGLAVGISPGVSVISVTATGGLTASANLTVTPAALDCDGIGLVTQWSLDLSYTYAAGRLTGENNQVSVQHAGDFAATLLPAGGLLPAVQWSGLLTGNASMNDRVVDLNSTPNITETFAGNGPPTTGAGQSSFVLRINLATCTFDFAVTPFVHVTHTVTDATGTRTDAGDVPVGILAATGDLGAWRALGMASLDEAFGAYSVFAASTRVGLNSYFPQGTGALLWTDGATPLAPEGAATVDFTILAK